MYRIMVLSENSDDFDVWVIKSYILRQLFGGAYRPDIVPVICRVLLI